VVATRQAALRRVVSRPGVVAGLIYAVLALLMVSPALPPGQTLSASDQLWNATPWHGQGDSSISPAGSNAQIEDQYRVFQPFLEHSREVLPRIPLWNPDLMAGRPFLANGQSAVFSPFSVPTYVLPFWRSFAVAAAFKLFVAALGAYLLGRALAMRFAGALLAGIVFAFSLWFVAWLSWPLTSTWAFLPWLWLAADAVARRPEPLPAAALSAVVGLQFLGGHPQSSFHVLVATAVFFGLRIARERSQLARGCVAFAGSVLLGTALAGLTLIPLAELLTRAADTSERAAFGDVHTPARYLLGLFVHDYWGRPTQVNIDRLGGPFLHTRALYVGALPLMLVPVALAIRATLERIGVAVLGAVCLAVVLGVPPLFDVVGALPGFRVTNNARLTVVFVLCVALLAGWGLSDLMERGGPARRRWLPVALGAALLALPFVWVVARGERPGLSVAGEALRAAWGLHELASPASPAGMVRVVETVRAAALLQWVVPAACGLALVVVGLRGRARPALIATVAVLLIVLDLFRADVGLNPAIPIEHAEQPTTPAIRMVQKRVPNRFVGLRSTQPFGPGDAVPTDLAMRYGLLDVRGYDFPVEERFMKFWRREVVNGPCAYHFCTSAAKTSPRALRALGLLGVTDLMTSPGDAELRMPGLVEVYDGPDARVYRNSRATPRAFLVGRQVVADDEAGALRAVASPTFEPLRAVVSEHAIAGVPTTAAAVGEPGVARITSYGAERVAVSVTAPARSVLVLTDAYYPGWKAEVDGESVEIERADYLFRAVTVPLGTHRVEFRYAPASWRAGLALSAAALLVLTGLLVLGLTGRRPSEPQPRVALKRVSGSTGVGSTPSSTAR
jgi:hypothetical protein